MLNTSLLDYDLEKKALKEFESIKDKLPERIIEMDLGDNKNIKKAIDGIWKSNPSIINYENYESIRKLFLKNFKYNDNPYLKLYRGISIYTDEEITNIRQLKKIINERHRLQKFISTTTDENVARKFSKTRIIPESYNAEKLNKDFSENYYSIVMTIDANVIYDIDSEYPNDLEESEIIVREITGMSILSVEKQLYLNPSISGLNEEEDDEYYYQFNDARK